MIEVRNLSKTYRVWDHPFSRVKTSCLTRVAQWCREGSRMKRRFHERARAYHKDFQALHPVSFEVPNATSVGILGRNGSGKSTLLQLIAGTLTPTSGSVEVRGRVAALLELGSGFNPEFTGRENVYMNALILGIPRHKVDERFDEIASFADIGEYMDQPVKTYSSGMYLRLAFSVITHVDADVLIVDEALAVGDVFFVQKCMRFLHNFQEHGVLLFVSHDLSSINSLCDHALWLDEGKLQMQGKPEMVVESYFDTYFRGEKDEEGANSVNEGSVGGDSENLPEDVRLSLNSHPVQVLGSFIEDVRFSSPRDFRWKGVYEWSNFNLMSDSFGEREAEVVDVWIEDPSGGGLEKFKPGDLVVAVIEAEAKADLLHPILGFGVKDSLGQVLFGENTFLTTEGEGRVVKKGERICAKFRIQFPVLRSGKYLMNATVATGTQLDHVMQHWVHDALEIICKVEHEPTGLMRLPMMKIVLDS